jgi:hypothetical protein
VEKKMPYTTPDEVRLGNTLTTTDIDNTKLQRMIDRAQMRLNHDIGKLVKEEVVWYIDIFRMNMRDGANTEYWVQNSFPSITHRAVGVNVPNDSFCYLGDLDNDGNLSTTDAVYYEYDISAKTKTSITITSLSEDGKIILERAPVGGSWGTITYRMFPISVTDPMLKTACEELATALAYSMIDPDQMERLEIGDLKVWRPKNQYEKCMRRYNDIVTQINTRWLTKQINSGRRMPNLGLIEVSSMDTNMGGVNMPNFPG